MAQYPPQQYPPQQQQCLGYPPPNQYGYSYLPPNQYGYQQPYYPPNQYNYPQPNQYNYPPLPNHYSYPHPPQHSISNYQWQGVPQYYSYPSPHQGSYPIQHHHASHQAASSHTQTTVPVPHDNRVFTTRCVDHKPHIRAKIQKQLLEAERKETERKRPEKLQKEARKKLDEERKRAIPWLLECMQFTSEVNSITRSGTWDVDEKRRLLLGIYLFGFSNWKSIQQIVSTRTSKQVGEKANKWCSCMSTIEATGALSTYEEVQAFYRQTLPKVEDIMNQLDIDKGGVVNPVTKEQWHKECEQGSKQAQQLVSVSKESGSTTSDISFELGSTHSITSNLDPNKINIECAKSIFQHYMIREKDVSNRAPPCQLPISLDGPRRKEFGPK